LGLYAFLTILLLWPTVGWGVVPWMTIYILGYSYIAGLNLIQYLPKTTERISSEKVGSRFHFVNNPVSYGKSIEALRGEHRVY